MPLLYVALCAFAILTAPALAMTYTVTAAGIVTSARTNMVEFAGLPNLGNQPVDGTTISRNGPIPFVLSLSFDAKNLSNVFNGLNELPPKDEQILRFRAGYAQVQFDGPERVFAIDSPSGFGMISLLNLINPATGALFDRDYFSARLYQEDARVRRNIQISVASTNPMADFLPSSDPDQNFTVTSSASARVAVTFIITNDIPDPGRRRHLSFESEAATITLTVQSATNVAGPTALALFMPAIIGLALFRRRHAR